MILPDDVVSPEIGIVEVSEFSWKFDIFFDATCGEVAYLEDGVLLEDVLRVLEIEEFVTRKCVVPSKVHYLRLRPCLDIVGIQTKGVEEGAIIRKVGPHHPVP